MQPESGQRRRSPTGPTPSGDPSEIDRLHAIIEAIFSHHKTDRVNPVDPSTVAVGELKQALSHKDLAEKAIRLALQEDGCRDAWSRLTLLAGVLEATDREIAQTLWTQIPIIHEVFRKLITHGPDYRLVVLSVLGSLCDPKGSVVVSTKFGDDLVDTICKIAEPGETIALMGVDGVSCEREKDVEARKPQVEWTISFIRRRYPQIKQDQYFPQLRSFLEQPLHGSNLQLIDKVMERIIKTGETEKSELLTVLEANSPVLAKNTHAMRNGTLRGGSDTYTLVAVALGQDDPGVIARILARAEHIAPNAVACGWNTGREPAGVANRMRRIGKFPSAVVVFAHANASIISASRYLVDLQPENSMPSERETTVFYSGNSDLGSKLSPGPRYPINELQGFLNWIQNYARPGDDGIFRIIIHGCRAGAGLDKRHEGKQKLEELWMSSSAPAALRGLQVGRLQKDPEYQPSLVVSIAKAITPLDLGFPVQVIGAKGLITDGNFDNSMFSVSDNGEHVPLTVAETRGKNVLLWTTDVVSLGAHARNGFSSL